MRLHTHRRSQGNKSFTVKKILHSRKPEHSSYKPKTQSTRWPDKLQVHTMTKFFSQSTMQLKMTHTTGSMENWGLAAATLLVDIMQRICTNIKTLGYHHIQYIKGIGKHVLKHGYLQKLMHQMHESCIFLKISWLINNLWHCAFHKTETPTFTE